MIQRNSMLTAVVAVGLAFVTFPVAHARADAAVTATISGTASWYGPQFHGGMTASGETFNMHDLTAAHPSLPFGTQVRVTNEANGEAVVVRINDRGPYAGNCQIDLSREAAQQIGMISAGVGRVTIEVLARA